MLHDWRRPVTPRSLSLWSLSTADPDPQRAGALIERAAIFGIDAPAVRVALGRLVRERMALQVERGVYAVGPAAVALHARARSWADAERRITAWNGRWIVILTDHLGRSDRPRLQARERALRLGGFAASPSGAWVRPDNLRREETALREDLKDLGLDDAAVMLAGCSAQPAEDRIFRALWPIAELEQSYRYWIVEMAASAERLGGLSVEAAARETYLLGQSVIRAINSDPLLPADLADAALRSTMIDQMIRYNDLALTYWARF